MWGSWNVDPALPPRACIFPESPPVSLYHYCFYNQVALETDRQEVQREVALVPGAGTSKGPTKPQLKMGLQAWVHLTGENMATNANQGRGPSTHTGTLAVSPPVSPPLSPPPALPPALDWIFASSWLHVESTLTWFHLWPNSEVSSSGEGTGSGLFDAEPWRA